MLTVGALGSIGGSSQISNSFSQGSIIGNTAVAGIVGAVIDPQIVMNVYSTMTITAADQAYPLIATNTANTDLVSPLDAEVLVAGTGYYSTTGNGELADDGSTRVTAQQLACPTGPNDESCADGSILYLGWSETIWSFGDNTQLPKLISIDGGYTESLTETVRDETETSDGGSASGALPWWLAIAPLVLLTARRRKA